MLHRPTISRAVQHAFMIDQHYPHDKLDPMLQAGLMANSRFPNFTIVSVPVPSSVDSMQAWGVHAIAAIDREHESEIRGHDDLAPTALDTTTSLQNQAYARKARFVALAQPSDAGRPNRVLGYASVDLPMVDNQHLGEIYVSVRQAFRGAGVGTALANTVIEYALGEGRRTLSAFSVAVSEPVAADPAALISPTGFGRVSRTDPSSAFALAFGFSLEQVERYSVLHLPVDLDRISRWRDEAQGKAGADYSVVQWVGDCPEEWAADYAMLNQRMSVDIPSAGLEFCEEQWDIERVRAMDKQKRAMGRRSFTTAVVHLPSGHLCAFSIIEASDSKPAALFQDNTLVLAEHRGRSLGLLTKAANLELVQKARPEGQRIHTWNAGENAHMLAINVRMGFVRAGVIGMWQRT